MISLCLYCEEHPPWFFVLSVLEPPPARFFAMFAENACFSLFIFLFVYSFSWLFIFSAVLSHSSASSCISFSVLFLKNSHCARRYVFGAPTSSQLPLNLRPIAFSPLFRPSCIASVSWISLFLPFGVFSRYVNILWFRQYAPIIA